MSIENDPSIICSTYQIEMEDRLRKNDMFYEFENAINKLTVLLDKKEIHFSDSNEGVFAKEIIYRLREESLGYIADLKHGAFFVANHHLRALIELYAAACLVNSDLEKGNKKRYLERFIRFPEIEFHKVYIKHKSAYLIFSDEILEKCFLPYSELKDDLLDIYNADTKEQLLEMDSWRGSCKISNSIEMITNDTAHIDNYRKLCPFTHISSFMRASESNLFSSLTDTKEQMLMVTIDYALKSYFMLRNENFFDKAVIKKLDDIFSPIPPFLMPKIKLLKQTKDCDSK